MDGAFRPDSAGADGPDAPQTRNELGTGRNRGRGFAKCHKGGSKVNAVEGEAPRILAGQCRQKDRRLDRAGADPRRRNLDRSLRSGLRRRSSMCGGPLIGFHLGPKVLCLNAVPGAKQCHWSKRTRSIEVAHVPSRATRRTHELVKVQRWRDAVWQSALEAVGEAKGSRAAPWRHPVCNW